MGGISAGTFWITLRAISLVVTWALVPDPSHAESREDGSTPEPVVTAASSLKSANGSSDANPAQSPQPLPGHTQQVETSELELAAAQAAAAELSILELKAELAAARPADAELSIADLGAELERWQAELDAVRRDANASRRLARILRRDTRTLRVGIALEHWRQERARAEIDPSTARRSASSEVAALVDELAQVLGLSAREAAESTITREEQVREIERLTQTRRIVEELAEVIESPRDAQVFDARVLIPFLAWQSKAWTWYRAPRADPDDERYGLNGCRADGVDQARFELEILRMDIGQCGEYVRGVRYGLAAHMHAVVCIKFRQQVESRDAHHAAGDVPVDEDRRNAWRDDIEQRLATLWAEYLRAGIQRHLPR